MENINLSQKEKMLLQDQKGHEKICIQKYTDYANQAQDSQLKQIFNANGDVEKSHLQTLNTLLGGQIPQMNQQQGQSSGQSAQGQSSAANMGSSQSAGFTNMGGSQAAAASMSDADLCTDMLMTEKYVSGAYDTSIFEFQDTRVRDILNHIQKEEQKHGEAISQYMQSKGMYKVK